MKMKKFAKIAVFALTAILLIGAAIGISAFAADETTVSVAGKNISYEGAVQVVYYVDAQNFDTATQSIRMDFWVGEQTEANKYTKGPDPRMLEKNGKSYYVFFSNGVAPKDMTVPVYAQPYVVNKADGTEAVRGDVVSYSVYTYGMNRFSQSPTADQITLYTALLDYGASVQEVFDNANVADYGWADAYYNITENVYVDGVLNADASTSGAKRPSELGDKLVDGKYMLPLANSQVGGAIYKDAFENSTGNSCAQNPVANPGTHTYNIYYSTGGFRNDMEGLTEVGPLFDGGKFVAGSNGSFYYDVGGHKVDDKTHNSYMVMETVDGNTYLSAGTNGTHYGGGFKIDLNDGTNVAPLPGVVYVLDFDFKVEKFDYTGPADRQAVYFGINKSVDSFSTAAGSSAADIASFGLYATEKDGTTSLSVTTDKNAVVNVGTWHDIHVEYIVIDESRAIVNIFIDGLFATTYASTNIATPETLRFEMRGSSNGMTNTEYHLDNLYFETYSYENTKGNGAYYNGTYSATSEVLYEFGEGTNLNDVVVKKGGYTALNDNTKGNYLTVENGELVVGTNGAAGDSTWGWWGIAGPDNSGNDGEVGTKYILEMDFKYGGGTGRDSDSRIAGSFGMNTYTAATYATANNSGKTFAGYSLYDGGNNVLNFGSKNTPAFSLESDIWYNVLFEYEIIANGFKLDNSTSYDGILKVYINGVLVSSNKFESSTVDINKTFGSLYFEHNGGDTKYTFDNIYMGIVSHGGTKGNGVYYNKYLNNELADPTVYDFSDDTSLELGDVFVDCSTKNSAGNAIYNNNFTLDNKVTVDSDGDGKNDSTGATDYSTRYALVTGSGAMEVGSYAWEGKGLLNANSIALEVGEMAVIESDILFLGSNAQNNYFMYFQVWNGDYTSLGTINLRPGAVTNGTSYNFYDTAHPVQMNEWHNMRIEITRTSTGATLAYFLDNTQVATTTTTTDASVISGLMMITRPAGATCLSFLYDNIVFANASKEPEAAPLYNSYYEAYQGGAVEYNGNVLNADSTLAWGFDESITLEKGTDKFMGSDTTADLNIKRDSTTGPYVNVSDGTLNFGLNHTVAVSGTVGEYDSNSYRVDKNVGLTGAVGKTYVIEYDFTFNGGTWDTDASGKKHDIMATRLIVSGGNVTTLFTGYRSADSEGNLTGLTIDCNNGGKQTQKLAVGTTYNLRFEIDITGESAATVNMYIDDVLYHSWNITRSGITSFVGVSNQLVLTANQDYAIDNFIATVIDTPAE